VREREGVRQTEMLEWDRRLCLYAMSCHYEPYHLPLIKWMLNTMSFECVCWSSDV